MSDRLWFKWKDVKRVRCNWRIPFQGLLMAKTLPKAEVMKVFSAH